MSYMKTKNINMKFMKAIPAFLLLLVFLVSCGKEDIKTEEMEPDETPSKRKIILLVGDGMGLSQITAAGVVKGQPLNLERCTYTGLQKTFSADVILTSSAASITAIACGFKTNYEYIGVDPNGNKLTNIAEILEANEYSTGIVTTSFIADNTPAGFYAHQIDRYEREAIAMDLMNVDLDVVIGGGRDHFNNRSDGLNLLDSLAEKGYQVFDNLESAMEVQQGKIACFTDEFKPPSISQGRGNMLSDGAEFALRLLDSNDEGFFLMIEAGQIDWACHENDQQYMLDEMIDFDKTVGIVLDYAEKDGNTLVIITADHETAGYAIIDGDESANLVEGAFINNGHTATMVPVFTYGPDAKEFKGVYQNTEFFYKFLDYYGLSK